MRKKRGQYCVYHNSDIFNSFNIISAKHFTRKETNQFLNDSSKLS